MTRPARAVLLGLGTGILGIVVSLTPPVLELEETAGLDWLFSVRGIRTPPGEVMIVSIDRHSAQRLGLPEDPEVWPRTIHAALVERLAAAGAAVIVFDIFFREPRSPQEDAALASAIDAAGNVILFEYIKKDITRMPGAGMQSGGELLTQRLIAPTATLAQGARALAPFPLPVFPIKVSQFWAFNPGTADLPTIPVVALQLYGSVIQGGLSQRLAALLPRDVREQAGVAAHIRALRALLLRNPELAGQALQASVEAEHGASAPPLWRALLAMYSGPDSYYLDFYGPPQTLSTVPYADVLHPGSAESALRPVPSLRGKAVFVGYSERLNPEQLDKFHTVFSQPNGLNLSGVEISATAFANLLENRHVSPLPMPARLLLVLGWGLLAGLALRLLPAIAAVAAGFGLGALYLVSASSLFAAAAIWLPLVAPLLIQLPVALFAALLWHYLEIRRERESIRTAFGYYLPAPVVDRLAHDLAEGRTDSQRMYGTCLATDAMQYTALSEQMDLEDLGRLMNAYYETLFGPVREKGGIVSDVVGDSMLAIWAAATPDPAVRRAALQAALAIDATVNEHGTEQAPHHLPTRIGLHSGRILLGSIGAIDHYEYRAVGDIVNTCSRIQGLNKYLGTRVLLSAEVLAGLGGFRTRELGTFLLAGKTRPLVIHELLGRTGAGSAPPQAAQHEHFAAALAAFRAGDFPRARSVFSRLANEDRDSVARYYLGLCRSQPPGPDWDGVIRMDEK